MEKERGHIKFIETDDGYRIEITGKDLKDALPGCCIPMSGACREIKIQCCTPEEDKK